MVNGFKKVFCEKIKNLHGIGCYFHYLSACRRKLQELHLTQKKYDNICNEFMNKFANFSFVENISKKRISKELNKIENKYKLNHVVSSNYVEQLSKLFIDGTICYLNIPKNIRTVNSVEIFNRYFTRNAMGKVW